MQTQDDKSTILGSWKEIAAYLGKGVRTVQRYEMKCALPVRRPPTHDKRIVMALTGELDAWASRRGDPASVHAAEAPRMSYGTQPRERLQELSMELTSHVTTLRNTIAKLIAMNEAIGQD